MAFTFEKIGSVTLTSAANTITFSSIPGTYTDIKMICSLIGGEANQYAAFQINGDTGTNYSHVRFRKPYSGNASGGGDTDATRQFIINTSADMSTTIPALAEVDILSYTNSSYKTYISKSSANKNGAGEFNYFQGVWRNTAAITSISVVGFSNRLYAIGSSVTLYGILKA